MCRPAKIRDADSVSEPRLLAEMHDVREHCACFYGNTGYPYDANQRPSSVVENIASRLPSGDHGGWR
jgi:hypothetical protein